MALSTQTAQGKPTLDSRVERRQTQRQQRKQRLVAVIIVSLGVLTLLYPVAATVLNNQKQKRIADNYAKNIARIPPAKLAQTVKDAEEYNARQGDGPILDPWLARIAPDNVAYQEYLHQLDVTEEMGRVTIPKIMVNLPIYHGTQAETLERGIGHLFGSSLPVGGKGTHAVITGHTGLSNMTLFDDLTKLTKGDDVYIQVANRRLKYRVISTHVVLPTDVSLLRPIEGKDLLTMLTCTPYGINTHRLLVTAESVPLDEKDKELMDNPPGPPWKWWMIVIVAGVAILIPVLAVLFRRRWRQKSEDERDGSAEGADDGFADAKNDGSYAGHEEHEGKASTVSRHDGGNKGGRSTVDEGDVSALQVEAGTESTNKAENEAPSGDGSTA
ncbi:MAG: class C sortase [Actinomycetaceae bacterium]|nr:class C sortase [Actinomycetaceae bacterium]